MDLLNFLKNSPTIWLSTHKSADGDGLGSEVALYHALKNQSYPVRIVHNDPAPERYSFLTADVEVSAVQDLKSTDFSPHDVAIIFDTNDPKLCEPLFSQLRKKEIKILFIDHHIVSEQSVEHASYLINENASCTGELVYELIHKAGFKINEKVATALYTSLLFDTQNFKFLRGSVTPFQMAIELIRAGADHQFIQHRLFENWTISKMNYLSKLIGQVQYRSGEIAIIPIHKDQLQAHNLDADDVGDLVDLFMSVKNLKVSIVVREEEPGYYKLSFRSRSREVLSWAREFGGGGHLRSAGAWVHDSGQNIIDKIWRQTGN